MTPIRLTVVMTHPVQYLSPWFRYIATERPELALTVLYATRPDAAQQAVGFGRSFVWDVSLTDGYASRTVRQPKPGESVHSSAFFGLDVPELVDALFDSNPDVVLIPGWHSVTLVRALWACRRRGIPVLYRGDTNLDNAPRGWRGVVWAARTAAVLRAYSGYLSVGKRARAYLDRFGVSSRKIFDSPHFVDNAFFAERARPFQYDASRLAVRASWQLQRDDFVVLFVGKLEPDKRVGDAVAAVHALGANARLLVVGSGENEQPVCSIDGAKCTRVSWAGFLNQTELSSAYAAADCLVLPSERETWGLVVNEAMATGLPCVVSDRVGCAPDLVANEQTGELFSRGDVASLTAALARVRDRIASGHGYADACRTRVSSYSMEHATDGLLAGCRAVARDHFASSRPRQVA